MAVVVGLADILVTAVEVLKHVLRPVLAEVVVVVVVVVVVTRRKTKLMVVVAE
jgi:hypothetical protein